MDKAEWDNLSDRHKLIKNLRALADAPGHMATIISQAADELEMAWQEISCLMPEDGSVAAVKARADGNADTCREMFKRMEEIRDTANAALRMDWFINGPGQSTRD